MLMSKPLPPISDVGDRQKKHSHHYKHNTLRYSLRSNSKNKLKLTFSFVLVKNVI